MALNDVSSDPFGRGNFYRVSKYDVLRVHGEFRERSSRSPGTYQKRSRFASDVKDDRGQETKTVLADKAASLHLAEDLVLLPLSLGVECGAKNYQFFVLS